MIDDFRGGKKDWGRHKKHLQHNIVQKTYKLIDLILKILVPLHSYLIGELEVTGITKEVRGVSVLNIAQHEQFQVWQANLRLHN